MLFHGQALGSGTVCSGTKGLPVSMDTNGEVWRSPNTVRLMLLPDILVYTFILSVEFFTGSFFFGVGL